MAYTNNTDNIVLLFQDNMPSNHCNFVDVSIFQIDESHYKANDIHYKIGIKNLTDEHSKDSYYTSDLKSLIDAINREDHEIAFGFYEKGVEITDVELLKRSYGLVFFQGKTDKSKCILVALKSNGGKVLFDSSDLVWIAGVNDAAKNLDGSSDVLDVICNDAVLDNYNAYPLRHLPEYLKNRVDERYKDL